LGLWGQFCTFDTADFRPAFVTHRGATLESRRVAEQAENGAPGQQMRRKREYRAINSATATTTKNPTKTCSRFASISHLLFPDDLHGLGGGLRQHLQIIKFPGNRGFRNPVKKLTNLGVLAVFHFFGGAEEATTLSLLIKPCDPSGMRLPVRV
jgi:hypothetical protein